MNKDFSYDTEKEIRQYWIDNKIPEKVREKEGSKNYYFIDGPPYATGNLHIGTAFNRILKDYIIRFKRMDGYKVLDTPGFDTHGLPTELKTQKVHGLKTKKDIEDFGMDRFIEECRNFATQNIKKMSEAIFNLGQWMDWEKPYRTLDKEYMLTGWWVFKKADEQNRVYHGQYPVHVCPSCETGVSYNEIEHKDLTEESIYVKMKIKNENNKYLIIWTTTPWTLTANLGIMVHPNYDYVELKYENEIYVLAKELVSPVIKACGLEGAEVVKEFKGSELENIKYEPILGEWLNIPEEYITKSYKVVSAPRFVHLEEGTGFVHCAPGHGKEDYQVGKDNDLPIYCPVTEAGEYDETVPSLKGKKVKEQDGFIIAYLRQKNMLLGTKSITHSYPTCWRCHSPLIQIAKSQWFIKVEDMRERLREINEKEVTWFPSWAKDRFDNWLASLSDWPVSRERYWGIPLPIWICDKCQKRKVYGSLEELKKDAKDLDLNMDIHRPYIDKVVFDCECGGKFTRIPEVFDVWFDSGIASFASIKYPKQKELFDNFWPPDINIEGSDQIRGWWNSQMICSALCFDKAPYKFVSLHGMVLSVDRRKLSKSEGNDIELEERFNMHSIDYYRYYLIREYAGTDLLIDLNKFRDVKKIFNILENCFNYLQLYNSEVGFVKDLEITNKDSLEIEDEWLLSRFNNIVKSYKDNSNKMMLSKMVSDLENFILEDYSRIYIKLLKKRENKNKILNYVYSNILILLSPIVPHFSEHLYQKFENKTETIHLFSLPQVNNDFINDELENIFDIAQQVIQTTLSLRENTKKRLKWVLPELLVKVNDEKVNGLEKMFSIIKHMTNIENIGVITDEPKDGYESLNVNENIKVYVSKNIPESYKEEWELSELTRLIQSERKAKKLIPSQVVSLTISCDDKVFLEKFKERIEEATSTTIEIKDFNDFKEKEQTLIDKKVCFSF